MHVLGNQRELTEDEGFPVVVVCGAPLVWERRLVQQVMQARFVLAADGGANHLAVLGIQPDAVIGDLDSIRPEVIGWVGRKKLLRMPDQDTTDLEKALRWIFARWQQPRVRVLAALGGRPDHSVYNLGLVGRYAAGKRLVLVDQDWEVMAFRTPSKLRSYPGQTWSFWSLEGCRASISGVKWPISEATLDPVAAMSVSNEAVSEWVKVVPSEGVVFVSRRIRHEVEES